jgi:hypothetical protein
MVIGASAGISDWGDADIDATKIDAHRTELRQAAQDRKLVSEVIALCVNLAAKRDQLAASIARTALYNANREQSQGFVVDAEMQVRQQPFRVIPAVHEDHEEWSDPTGNRPSEYRERYGPGSELIPTSDGLDVGHGRYEKKTVSVLISRERDVAAYLPERFSSSLALFDLAGKRL